MVLLTSTPVIAEALKVWPRQSLDTDGANGNCDSLPSHQEVQAGKPISHQQILRLWQELRSNGSTEYTLESLLRGSQVYIPPPPPKPEPTPEYKALMARLREKEEQKKYQCMVNPPKMETFSQRFPNAVQFAEANRAQAEDIGNDEEATYEEIRRQLMLILNFLVSIAGVGATLWIVAQWWSTPARLALSMGGALVVGIAEVAVYSAFVWRVDTDDKKFKKSQEKLNEVRAVTKTWIIDKDGVRESGDTELETIPEAPWMDEHNQNSGLRHRIVTAE